MRKYITCLGFFMFIVFSATHAQNVGEVGRWAEGHCESIYRRGEYTFLGNGAYLEAYRKINIGGYQRIDRILMDAPIEDIWVKSDTTHIFVACGDTGLQVVYFDADEPTDQFVQIIGRHDTDGFASGVCEYNGYTYVADGENGLVVFNTGFPSSPDQIGHLPLDGEAHDIWIVGGLRALIPADTAGLYMVDISVPSEPEILDQFSVPTIFPTRDKPAAYNIISFDDSLAYLSAGWGGMHILDVHNLSDINPLVSWPTTGKALEVHDTWITGHYAHLACGEDGFYTQIDISDYENITGPQSKANDTDGFATKIIVESDTAFAADSHNGHLILDVDLINVPSVMASFPMADICYDVQRSGNYAYVAAGRAGLKVFEVQENYPDNEMIPLSSINTTGEVRSVKKTGALAFCADGSRGVKLFDVTDAENPEQIGAFNQALDDCYDIAAPEGPYLFAAYGHDGMKVLDYSNLNDIQQIFSFQTPGFARAIKMLGNQIFLADSSSIIVYQATGLPGFITSISRIDSLTSATLPIDAYNLYVDEYVVYVANGANGIIAWDRFGDTIERFEVDGVCTDIYVIENTFYVTVENEGLRLFNYTDSGTLSPIGGYATKGNALGLDVSDSGERIMVAAGEAGLYDFSSALRPQIEVQPEELNFGQVALGYSRSIKLNISNPGTQNLFVNQIQFSESTSVFTFSETRFTVPPGGTYSVLVTYTPSAQGSSGDANVAYIYSNATPSSYPVWLSGSRSDPHDALPYDVDIFSLGLWHFDETTGFEVVDETENDLVGLAQGTPVRVDAKPGFGSAIQFNDAGDRIVIQNHPLLNLYNSPLTLELWFKATEMPTGRAVLAKYGIGDNEQYELALLGGDVDNGLIARLWDSNGFSHTVYGVPLTELSVNQWYHASMAWDGDSLRLYLNGVQRGGIALSGGLLNISTETLTIGSDANGNNTFLGTIDEIRLSDIARQEWEYNVDRSRMIVDIDPIGFGDVVRGESRKRTFRIASAGSDSLEILGISTTHNQVSVSTTTGFKLASGQDTTLWITFSPEESLTLDGLASLVIASSDPTYPFISIPIQGRGVLTLPAGSYPADPFTLALYHFEEIAETTVFDSSGNDMHGELFNSILADSENGKFGQYLIFESVDQYCAVEPVESPSIGPILGGFTAEAWIRMQRHPDLEGTVMRRGNTETNQFSIVIDTSAQILARIWQNDNELVELNSFEIDPIVAHIWYHVALTYDAANRSVQLFINGNAVSGAVLSRPMMGSDESHLIHDAPLYIGGDPSETKLFNGSIDEVRLSSTARQVWEFNVNLSRSYIYPAWIDFGKVFISSSQDEYFWVKNTGLEDLIVSDILIDSNHEEYFDISPRSFTLGQEQIQQVRILYAPDAVGTHTADLELVSNNLFPDQQIHLQGVCIDSSISGPYDWDTYTLSLIHFEQDSDTNLISGGHVSWSDTSRFGSSSLRLRNGWVNIPIDTSLDLSQQRFTLETWFSLAQIPTSAWTLLYWGSGNQWIQFLIDPAENRGLQVRLSNSNGTIYTLSGKPFSQIIDNYWYHLSLAWSGDTLKVYVNNTLYGTSLFSGTLNIPSGQPIRFGAHYMDETFPFQGWIDEFRLSSKERKPWEFNVVSPLISLSTRRIDFATVETGQTRSLPIYMTNLGDQDLSVYSIDIADEDFSVSGVTLPLTIPRMHYVTAQVQFHPETPDTSYETTLTILSNDTTVTSSVVTLWGKSVGRKRNEEFSTNDPFTVALYHFNHDLTDTTLADTILYDPTGSGRHGVIYGASWIAEGLYSEALEFNGIDNWAEIPSADNWVFDMSTDPFTIEFSMKTDTVKAYQTLVFKGVRDTVHYGMYLNGNGQISVYGFGSGGPRLNDGLWHQIAFVYDPAANSRLYVDGELVLSRIWINSEGVDAGHPLMFGAGLSNSERVERYFQGTIDEFRLSNIARAAWEVTPSDYGIEVASINQTNLMATDTLALFIYPPASLGIDSLLVHYRRGGGRHPYAQVAATVHDDTFYVNIPPDSLTLNGIEYYVDARTQGGVHFTAPSYAPAYNPYSISVYHNDLSDSLTYYTQEVEESGSGSKYQKAALFSIPTQLTEIAADSVFKDLFPYNPYKWRLFWWHSSRSQAKLDSGLAEVYLEYPPPAAYPEYFQVYPGRAFWIVSKEEQSFHPPTGYSVRTDRAFEIALNHGWNMFGSPFWFPVAWDDCSIANTNLINTIYAWNGDEGYNSEIAMLEPWIGYFVYNPDTVTAYLTIPPREAKSRSGDAPSIFKKHIAFGMQENEWMIRLEAESGMSKDCYNYAGIRVEAEAGLDPYDQMEPPPSLGKQVSLNFIPQDGLDFSGRLAGDIRSFGTDGQTWLLELRGCGQDQSFRLNWSWINDLPDNWECYLIDLEEGNSVNCREKETIVRTERRSNSISYAFKLIAGTPEYVDDNRDGVSLVPIEFALHQNYPNPFNPETTIRYSLPRASKVRITIFNVLGQAVKTIHKNHDMAGHFQIVWNATNNYGIQVSSGVYFYQIRAEDHIANRKMVVIR